MPFPLIGLAIGLAAGQTVAGVAANKAAAAQQKRQFLIAQMFARRRAADAISRGGHDVASTFAESDRIKGYQRASIAGRGLQAGVGTAQDIPNATDLIASLDAIAIRENARREAQGAMMDAYSAGEGAKGASSKAANFGTLIGGASTIAGQLYDYKRAGR